MLFCMSLLEILKCDRLKMSHVTNSSKCIHLLPPACTDTSVHTSGLQLNQMPLGLYRIYFFPIPLKPDLSSHIRPDAELDFQIDCNFTNLMCKTLRTHEWFEFLIIFCAAVTVTTFLISGFLTYLGLLDSYYSSKLSNVWEKSTFQIQQNYLALVGFLPETDFCQIWKKVPYSGQSRNPAQP